MGVVSKRQVRVESMGVASGYNCKEVFIDFFIIINPTPTAFV